MSSKLVSRRKYEKAKDAAISWHELYEQSQEQLYVLKEENNSLSTINKELKNRLSKQRSEIDRWKKLSENLPDPELLEELEVENKQYRQENRKLKKDIRILKEKYKDHVARLEREKLLSDGKIQQLEEAKKDLRERLNDLKQDYRETARWNRGLPNHVD